MSLRFALLADVVDGSAELCCPAVLMLTVDPELSAAAEE